MLNIVNYITVLLCSNFIIFKIDSVALVLAVVTKTQEQGAKAELKITRVYAGDASLTDAVFVDRLARQMSVKTDGFKVGEEGLWSVVGSREKLVVTRNPILPFTGCARKRFYQRYDELMAVAEAVSSVAAAPAERRPRLLTGYALSRTPEVAAWAVVALDAGGGHSTNSPPGRML